MYMDLHSAHFSDEEDDGAAEALVSTRRFKDIVHDYIPFSPLVCRLIDTRHFQRLRNIKQLGVSYYVWPCASHNRFEHCLGVAYLARRMAEHLQLSQPNLRISERDVKCVEIAGLCHDLGHGPWSHVWDGLFIPTALKGKKWKHEDASEMLFDHMLQEYATDIEDNDAAFIKALIAGDPTRCVEGTEKPFLFDIVANKRNGIDVDKFDYIARDCAAVGDKGNLSLTRLINSARVINDQICYDIKDANQIYELCYTRFSLHKRIYNHKTAKAIEYMIIDILLAADPHMKIAAQVDDPEKFLFLTDEILTRIEMTTCEELREARAIIERFRSRDLYKCVDYKVFSWQYRDLCREHITPKSIVAAAKSITSGDINEEIIAALEDRLVIVDLSPMHYGMQEKNPMDFVKFYSKHNPNTCRVAGPGDISLLMPSSFGEILLRVYTKDSRFFGIVQAGYRQVLKTMDAFIELSEASSVPTPPATEAPSTPRPFSRNQSFSQVANISNLSVGSPFADNAFTTVPVAFPPSPSQEAKKPKGKRSRDIGGSTDSANSPPRKKRIQRF